MSGALVLSPYVADTTLAEDGQPQASITPAVLRQIIASLSAIYSTTQTGNWTFAITDRGTRVRYNSSSAGTFTIPPNSSVAFVVNTVLLGCQVGTGQLAFAAGAGVTLHTPASLTARTLWSTIWAIQDSANVWIMGGDLT